MSVLMLRLKLKQDAFDHARLSTPIGAWLVRVISSVCCLCLRHGNALDDVAESCSAPSK